ncbi:hypothetical protein [Streptomyces sp. NPDC002573]|uniref:hypothetical protein n=1 Tax=Streptomyces sp. NPDC002573 TaxID=3364651 RepID=UPI0036A37553
MRANLFNGLSVDDLDAHTRLDVDPETVGQLIRRSLHHDSALGEETINALLDMALPPSAKSSES